MKYYTYRCDFCCTTFLPDKVDKKVFYLCPNCGRAAKNTPLEGVLSIDYNYDQIAKTISSQEFICYQPGKIWKYPYLWPVDFDKTNPQVLDRLSLPENTLMKYQIDNREVLLLDETRNPTLSYKDRATSLVVLKALELGISEIAAASTGNAGSSLAGICARLGLKSHIYVPKNIPEEKRIQIEAYGANLVVVEGDYDLAFDKCLEDSKANGWYNRNTAYNPLTIEGKKSAAFDIFIQMKGIIPNVIIIPVGDGVIISGIYKGFEDLQKLGWINKLPQLIAVQSEKSNAVVRYVESNEFHYRPATTIADSISAGAPRNLFMAARAIKKSYGMAVSVTDEQILTDQKEFIKKTGILCEPSSAATYSAFKNLKDNDILKNKSVLLLITGNGLKDTKNLRKN